MKLTYVKVAIISMAVLVAASIFMILISEAMGIDFVIGILFMALFGIGIGMLLGMKNLSNG